MVTELAPNLQQVEAARDMYAHLLLVEDQFDQEYKTALASFEERHADLMQKRKEAREARQKQEEYLRSSAVEFFKLSEKQSKALTAGVDIQERTRVEYDPVAIVPVLLQFAPFLLVPNDKAIKDLGEAMLMGKGDLNAAVAARLPITARKEYVAAIGGVKTMSGVMQINSAMSIIGQPPAPKSKAKPITPHFEAVDDSAVDTAVSALDVLNQDTPLGNGELEAELG